MKMFKKAFFAIVLASLMAGAPAFSADFDFSGYMPYHNTVLLFGISVAAPSDVTLFSSSWDDGNFDPMLGFWTSAGDLIAFQDDGLNIGTTSSNGFPYDHGTWDSYYAVPGLAAGSYLVTLTTFANFNNGATLSAGFAYDGQTPIPISGWDQPANPTGHDGSYYAFHILNVNEATHTPPSVPVAGALWLLGSGLVGLVGLRRKVKS